MLMLASDSLKLVLEDKLFKNQSEVFALVGVSAGVTAALFLWLTSRETPVWMAAGAAGLAGGFGMPYLLKDIKFR